MLAWGREGDGADLESADRLDGDGEGAVVAVGRDRGDAVGRGQEMGEVGDGLIWTVVEPIVVDGAVDGDLVPIVDAKASEGCVELSKRRGRIAGDYGRWAEFEAEQTLTFVARCHGPECRVFVATVV